MEEKISVLIPVYNREKYIAACIESILSQTYGNIDIIVYDDGSTDATKQIVRSYHGVILIEGKMNRGVSYARNRLLEACRTRYAAWQDSDDVAAPGRIEAQYNKIKNTSLALVFCHCVNIVQINNTSAENVRCMGGVMFDADMARHILFNEAVLWGAEDNLWLAKLQKLYGQAGLLEDRLYFIRIHSDRISSKKRLPSNREAQEASDKAYLDELKKYSQ